MLKNLKKIRVSCTNCDIIKDYSPEEFGRVFYPYKDSFFLGFPDLVCVECFCKCMVEFTSKNEYGGSSENNSKGNKDE